MKGDFTRQTFDPRRHFTTVRMQQGRVQLDADWNEQADLTLYRVETEAADVIGGCGGPLDAAAFGIVLNLDDLDPVEKARLQALDPPYAIVAGDFVLTPGRYYVDGILCESEGAVPYTLQPDLPGLDPIDVSQAGFTVVYLDVWQRHLTWLDDPLLRETALGGPDTATRTRTVWQVRTVFAGADPVTCVDNPQPYLDAIAAGTGLLAARAKREEAVVDPCIVPASAGYRGLENQLYRVEIHNPGDAYDVTAGPGDQAITVAAADKVVYSGGSWSVGETVEIFRSAAGSDPMEGFLATVVANDTGTDTLTLSRSLPDLGPADVPRIRPVEATFKWSRDNGSVVTQVSSVTDRDVVVTSLGPDDSRFLPGHLVELIDEVTELDGRPGFLVEIEDVDKASRTVTLRVEPPAFTGELLKLRRWDGAGAVKTNPPGTTEPFVELEDGVQVSFSDGTYKTGDHWLIPARTATADERSGTIEWPADEDGDPLELPPAGIRHHYCKLAILQSDGTTLTLEDDCRNLFPPLTQLATLVYVGGDGQEAMPGQPVPQLLEAGVFRGRRPVKGARVRFTADAGGKLAADLGSVGGGSLSIERATGDDGIAACAWLPANDLARPSQQVEARLLDAGGNPLAPQLDYNGQLSIASQVAYEPGACADLASATTVQEALDILCKRPTGGSCCLVVEPETPLDELLKKLEADKVRDICLCLKPGNYKLQVEMARDPVETFSIEACCPGVRVEVGRFQLFKLDEVRLRGLDLVLQTDQPLLLDGCAEVVVEDCSVTRVEAPGPACLIRGAERLRIADSVLDGSVGVADANLDDFRDLIALPTRAFTLKARELADNLARDAETRKALATKIARARRTERLSLGEQEAYALLAETLKEEAPPQAIVAALGRLRRAAKFVAFAGPALVLADGFAEALVEGTDIVGALALYGDPPGALPTQDLLKRVAAGLAQGAISLLPGGSLHVRDVRVSKVTVAAEMLDKMVSIGNGGNFVGTVFRALHVVDTEVLVNENVAVAKHATLTGDDWAGLQNDVGALIADSAIVNANRAPNDFRLFVATNALETAANLRINVVRL